MRADRSSMLRCIPLAALVVFLAVLLSATIGVYAQAMPKVTTISVPLAPDPDSTPPKGTAQCPPTLQVISKAGSMLTLVVAGTAAIDVNDIDVTSCLLIAMPNVDDAPFSMAVRPSSTKIGDFTSAVTTWPKFAAQAQCDVCGGCDITDSSNVGSKQPTNNCFEAQGKNDQHPDLRLTFDAQKVSKQFNIVKNTCGVTSVLKLRCGSLTDTDTEMKVYEGFVAPQLTYPTNPARGEANPRQAISPAVNCEEDPAYITCPGQDVIAVEAAAWGRFNDDVCPTALLPAGSPELQVPVEGCSKDYTDAVAKVCNGAKTCRLTSTSSTVDPCPQADGRTISKYFEVFFRCVKPDTAVAGTPIRAAAMPNAGFSLNNTLLNSTSNSTMNGTATSTVTPNTTIATPMSTNNTLDGMTMSANATLNSTSNSTNGNTTVPAGQRQRGFVCAGSTETIACEGDTQTLKVVTAEYGRSSKAVCASDIDPLLVQDTNCKLDVLAKVAPMCAMTPGPFCTVTANTTELGDPCPATYKYITVQYECLG